MKQQISRHIPNALTCANLLCGCVGIIEVFHSNILLSCGLIVLAAVFDFLDGFVARLLKVTSAIGKELDSLADVVTFGVLPAFIVYQLLLESIPDLSGIGTAYFALFIAIFSALRLAKFNTDPRQHDTFIGVPTPANALLIASLPLIVRFHPEWAPYIVNTTHLLLFTALMSYLLVAELPLFAFKFKTFRFEGNEVRYIFLGVSLVALALLDVRAMPLLVSLYVLFSFYLARFRK